MKYFWAITSILAAAMFFGDLWRHNIEDAIINALLVIVFAQYAREAARGEQ